MDFILPVYYVGLCVWFCCTCSVIIPLPIRDFLCPLSQSEASSRMRHFAALYENPTYITHFHPTLSADHKRTHTHSIRQGFICSGYAIFLYQSCHISIFKVTLHKTVLFLNEQHVMCVVWLSFDYSSLMVMDRLKDVSSN